MDAFDNGCLQIIGGSVVMKLFSKLFTIEGKLAEINFSQAKDPVSCDCLWLCKDVLYNFNVCTTYNLLFVAGGGEKLLFFLPGHTVSSGS